MPRSKHHRLFLCRQNLLAPCWGQLLLTKNGSGIRKKTYFLRWNGCFCRSFWISEQPPKAPSNAWSCRCFRCLSWLLLYAVQSGRLWHGWNELRLVLTNTCMKCGSSSYSYWIAHRETNATNDEPIHQGTLLHHHGLAGLWVFAFVQAQGVGTNTPHLFQHCKDMPTPRKVVVNPRRLPAARSRTSKI